jgi:hypothetical protein
MSLCRNKMSANMSLWSDKITRFWFSEPGAQSAFLTWFKSQLLKTNSEHKILFFVFMKIEYQWYIHEMLISPVFFINFKRFVVYSHLPLLQKMLC